jgi:RNA polymerase primary sigma factor
MSYRTNVASNQLLTGEEEIVLGRKVQSGILAAERIKNGDYVRPELRKLRIEVRAGDVARNEFVEHNMRLAMNVASKYAKAQPQMDYEDLIQESCIGLIRAVEKFDPTKGFKFSTYATWWCRQACQRAVANQSRPVRLPMHIEASVRKLQRAMETIEGETGAMPPMSAVAEALGWEVDHCEELLRYLDVTRVSSLDDPISEDSSLTREDTVFDPTEPLPDELGLREPRAMEVREAIAFLEPRERDILYRRHGIGEFERPMTLQDIGDALNLTRERIRQIEAKAVSRLRHPSAGIVDCFGED